MKPVAENSWRYRGWRVVVVAAVAMVATLPGRTVGLGLITEPLLADLQITRTHYANITLWATILGALFSPLCGRVIDRLGVRITLSTVVLILGLTTIGMSVWLSVGNLLLFAILSRGLGQSSLSTASVTAVGKWFRSKLGIALGVFSALVALGFATAIPVVGGFISTEEWRIGWRGIGIALVVLSVIAFLAIPGNETESSHRKGEETPSTTWSAALQTPAFWTFTISTALYYLVLSGLTLFTEDVLSKLGFARNVYIPAMASMMGAGLIGNFAAGWLSSRWTVTKLLTISLLILAAVLLRLPSLRSEGEVMFLFAMYGVCGGAFAVLFFVGYGQAFGQSHLGKIQGTAQALGVVASALGPKLLAETEAATGSYFPALSLDGRGRNRFRSRVVVDPDANPAT